MANMLEVVDGIEPASCRTTCASSARSTCCGPGFFARKDSGIVNMADVKGKRVPTGYSAMRTLDTNTRRCSRPAA